MFGFINMDRTVSLLICVLTAKMCWCSVESVIQSHKEIMPTNRTMNGTREARCKS